MSPFRTTAVASFAVADDELNFLEGVHHLVLLAEDLHDLVPSSVMALMELQDQFDCFHIVQDDLYHVVVQVPNVKRNY